jgi:hypothetical protein
VSRGPAGWRQALECNVMANPAYQLRALGALPDRYRRSLEGLGVDLSNVFGFLVGEAGSGLPDKLVDVAGANLFRSLRQPGHLPPSAAGRLAELVLDGVLGLESTDGFVYGPAAYEAVAQLDELPVPHDRLSRLSHAALAYAGRLRLGDVDRVCARLYCYHRIPLSRRWARAYPNSTAVLDLVRGAALSRSWVGPTEGEESADWLSWARRDNDRRDARPGQLPYKLYVSPHVDDLADVFPALVEALTAAGASRFKMGADAEGLLRPDKIVVYLADARELENVARAVEFALDGVRPHGVPFSAELAGDGLLSWGGDPPEDAGPVGAGAESWRLSVCRRLAEYLVAAQAAPLRHTRPAEFALARLAVDGVDVRSFAPADLDAPRRAERMPLERP